MTISVNLDEVLRAVAALPEQLERNILRGAIRAGAESYANRARENCRSDEVRATIKTSTRAEPGLITAKVQTKGPGAYKAPWLENGTEAHFISVDDAQSDGKTVRRINRETARGSLVISGKFVGTTVHHPGARPYPFMRPAADMGGPDALAAMGAYITARATKEGLMAAPVEQEQDAEE